MSVLNPNSDDEPQECPLCMEFLELDDINFYPCSCGYQVSFFIHFYYNILKTCDCLVWGWIALFRWVRQECDRTLGNQTEILG